MALPNLMITYIQLAMQSMTPVTSNRSFTVVTIEPLSGTAAGGTTVSITGTNFVAGKTSVLFGDVAATSIVVNSDTSMTVTVPPVAGVVDVRVTTTFGTVLVPAAYTYSAAVVATVQIPVDSWWMLIALALSLAAGGFIQWKRRCPLP